MSDDLPAPTTVGVHVDRSRRIGRAVLLLCVVPAVLLAACSLGDDGDEASSDTSSPAGSPPGSTAPSGASSTPRPPASDGTGPAGSGASATDADGAGADAAISFTGDVEPIVEATCASCHTGDGPGTQHVVMDRAGDVAFASAGIELVTASGYMPPWPAGDESVAFEHDWSLTDDEIDVLARWHAAGSPLDVPDDHPIEPENGVVGLADPDVVVEPSGTYDGVAGQPDEYRCFVYDPGVTETSFVEAMEFRPDQAQVVHHAVGSVIPAAETDRLDALAAAEDDGQGGWTCFGFSPSPSASLVLGWAPGQAPTRYGEGSGLRMDPGDVFVVQIHYHYEFDAPADRSTLAIEWADDPASTEPISVDVLLAPAEIPCSTEESGPLCDREEARQEAVAKYGPEGVLADVILALCGRSAEEFASMTEGIASASCDQPIRSPGEIVNVFGHQHELGASFRMTLHPDTPDEIVLLDIPRWDFDWQMLYDPVEDIVVEPGDVVRIECSWDRSLRDPALEPAYVLWADGTDDEMCFATITTRPT
jgi:hypothetical protein